MNQVAREGKVDQLRSLVQLENLENIRTWVNRYNDDGGGGDNE